MILQGAAERRKAEHAEMAWAVWHTAYLTAYAPRKARQFPRLHKLLGEPGPSGKRMSPEALQASVRDWLARRKR